MNKAFVTGGSGFVGGRLILALRARGVAVVALARSDASAAKVEAAGAVATRGDLDDTAALEAGIRGCDVVFHAAAHTDQFDPLDVHMRITARGTEHVLAAAKAAGAARFVHVSTEAVLADGKPIVRADETRPLPTRAMGPYPHTKRLAEQAVLAANAPGFATVVVRPRMVWGKGDTSLLPEFIDAVKAGKYAWIGGGRYLTSTCHVDNVAHGLPSPRSAAPPARSTSSPTANPSSSATSSRSSSRPRASTRAPAASRAGWRAPWSRSQPG